MTDYNEGGLSAAQQRRLLALQMVNDMPVGAKGPLGGTPPRTGKELVRLASWVLGRADSWDSDVREEGDPDVQQVVLAQGRWSDLPPEIQGILKTFGAGPSSGGHGEGDPDGERLDYAADGSAIRYRGRAWVPNEDQDVTVKGEDSEHHVFDSHISGGVSEFVRAGDLIRYDEKVWRPATDEEAAELGDWEENEEGTLAQFLRRMGEYAARMGSEGVRIRHDGLVLLRDGQHYNVVRGGSRNSTDYPEAVTWTPDNGEPQTALVNGDGTAILWQGARYEATDEEGMLAFEGVTPGSISDVIAFRDQWLSERGA